MAAWGVGTVQYGTINWNQSGNFNAFYSPIYATETYHCVDSLGSCYFKGY